MISTAVYATFSVGSWRCYRSPDGKTPVYIGCSHRSPSSAIAHKANLDPYVRASGGASTPVPVPPVSGSGLMDAPSESRKRDSRLFEDAGS